MFGFTFPEIMRKDNKNERKPMMILKVFIIFAPK